jgi:hypothetical protein
MSGCGDSFTRSKSIRAFTPVFAGYAVNALIAGSTRILRFRSRMLRAYLSRFQTVSADPPTLAPGLVHLRSSPVKDVTVRF